MRKFTRCSCSAFFNETIIFEHSAQFIEICFFERKPVIEVFASKEPEINQYSNGAYCHWITFKDNGIGFEQEYAESIFKIFTRLHGLEEYDGSGVGLALCKKIMQTCNGTIRAVSKLNEGTEIIIYFPCDTINSLSISNDSNDYGIIMN